MKNIVRIFLSVLMLLCSITLYAEHRFFPANSIHCVNVVWGEKDVHRYDPIRNEYGHRPIYYHYYTGNDTIVDDKPCVMLWKYCADTPEEKELRFLCEEDGLISYKYPLAEGGYSDWKVLYEFPEGGWKKGESYIIGLYQGKPDKAELDPIPYTLLNGEETQIAYGNSLIYGIGYNNWPFLEYWEFSDFEYPSKMQPHSFYRNDTLLWGKPATYGPFFPTNSVRCTNMITSLYTNDTIYYNLYTGGDTIVDGKECVQLWGYCTDTPEDLVQHLLHEEDDKVYIKYSTSEDEEWQLLYDFSLPVWHVGDSIEHAESYRIPIESVDTITMLNGKTRQVARCRGGGWLIHGMGYIGEPFFTSIYHLETDDGTESYPVSFYYWNELLLGEELPKKREQRYFPANGIYATNLYVGPNCIHNGNQIEYIEHPDSIYYNVWTGNDTIVDGRECVVVWCNYSGDATRQSVLYESINGVVYLNYLGEHDRWQLLYDFTPRHWKSGDLIFSNVGGMLDQYGKVEEVSSIVLMNGEVVPVVNDWSAVELIYGIGYRNEPFLSPIEVYSGSSGKSYPISFYRNGELLWGKEEKPGNSVAPSVVNKFPTPYYDLQGRKVANPTRGIYIKDGRKVVIGQ